MKITSERTLKTTGVITQQVRFYIASLACSANEMNQVVRSHWSIENNLHWCLDMVYREDHLGNRKGHSDRNLAMLRKIALNLLKEE